MTRIQSKHDLPPKFAKKYVAPKREKPFAEGQRSLEKRERALFSQGLEASIALVQRPQKEPSA